ncbi:MAG: hypothetical protein WAO28_01730 [Candidatus Microsaccharimonas sp.]
MTKKRIIRKSKKQSYGSHIRSSLTYVAPHAHTGRRLPHKHTSHGVLLILLIIAGIILFFSLATLEAAGITRNGQLTVNAVVPGLPPTTGAVITSPETKVTVKNLLLEVAGTCPVDTIVAIYNNGTFSSSTNCTSQNIFQVTVQLSTGINTLQAQNYDNLNQAGPATDQIEVNYAPDEPNQPALINTAADIKIDLSIPDSPAPQPTVQPCYEDPQGWNTPSGLGMLIPCITRNIFVGEKLELPVNIAGGVGPYALSVDWGDAEQPQLYSLQSSGWHTVSHVYKVPQIKNISLRLADSKGGSYQMQSVVEVNGNAAVPSLTEESGSSQPFDAINNVITSTWFEATVPVYWAAVTLFAGFWVGDIFQRIFRFAKR